MLGEPEPVKEAAEQLMSAEEGSIASKWVAASVQQMLPAGVADPLSTEPAGPSGAAAGDGQHSVLMETGHVDGAGG